MYGNLQNVRICLTEGFVNLYTIKFTYIVLIQLTKNLLSKSKILSLLTKREFIIDNGKERIHDFGYLHKNVAIKYLMKRRRSVLMTKNLEKVEALFVDLPRKISIIGKQITHNYEVNWERQGVTDFEGSRFVFTLKPLEN
jgi:hypothetical protein